MEQHSYSDNDPRRHGAFRKCRKGVSGSPATCLLPRPTFSSSFLWENERGEVGMEMCRGCAARHAVVRYLFLYYCSKCWNSMDFEELKG